MDQTPNTKYNQEDVKIFDRGQKIHQEFINNDNYMVENNGDYAIKYGANYAQENNGIAGTAAGMEIIDYGANKNLLDNLFGVFGIKLSNEMVPNAVAISHKLEELSPEKLYEFYRYFNTIGNDGSAMYETIKSVLGYNNLLEKATSVVTNAENIQNMHNLVNTVSDKISMGMIPLSTGLEILGITKKKYNESLDDELINDNSRTK